MTLIYTDKQAIANRLRGRLAIGGAQAPFGATVVDDELIEQVGVQVESRINAQLGRVYQLPILLNDTSKPILASVTEKLTICEIMGTHYVGAEGTSEDGYGRMMCRQGAEELQQILTGAIALEGATPISPDTGAVTATNYSSVRPRTPGAAEAIQW